MIAKDFVPIPGIRSFTIMEYLVRHCASKSHPPPRAHYPRIQDAFTAGRVTGWITSHIARVIHVITGAVKAATQDVRSRDGNHAGYFPARALTAGTTSHRAG